jgi:hypothetical protein
MCRACTVALLTGVGIHSVSEYERHIHEPGTSYLLSTDHALIPAGCKRPYCSARGVQSM